jgi:MYXO-CTERM domain-containing protein
VIRAAIATAIILAAGLTGTGAALAQPSDVTAAASNQQITLAWTAEGGVTYNVYVANETGVSVANIGVLDGGRVFEQVATPFTLSGLDNNRTYFFVVGEVGANGAVFESAEVSATPRGAWTGELVGTAITSVAADPEISGVYLAGGAGTGAGCDGADKVAGCDIFRSTDSGEIWESVTSSVNQIDIRAVDIRGGVGLALSLSTDNGTAASNEKLLLSSNGTTWELRVSPVASATPKVVTIDPNNSQNMYAATLSIGQVAGQSRILRSTTGGLSFVPSNEIAGGVLEARDLAVRPGDETVVWLGGGGTPPLARSTDGGQNYTAITTAGFTSVAALAMDPDLADNMWIGGVAGGVPSLQFSADGGVNFEERTSGLPGVSINDVAFDTVDDLLFVATAVGVFVSADRGLRFEELGVGLDVPVASIAYGPSGVIVAATGDGVFRLDLSPPVPVDPGPDAGVDAGGDPGDGGGCCQTSPGTGASTAVLALLVLIGATGRGRRRRAGRTRPA